MYAYVIVTLSHKIKFTMKEKSTIITCKICGKQEELRQYDDIYAGILNDAQMCHTCHHWHSQMKYDQEERGEHRWAIIDGQHFALLPSDSQSSFRGFNGREFRIRFNDGYETTCSNLWHQGDIPAGYWRNLMPDNAQFVTER